MSEENISLCELLDLSIGTPHEGAVNFSALHALLHAVLGQLEIRDTKTRWRDAPPGAAPGQETENHGDTVEVQTPSSPPSPPSPAADEQATLRSRIQTCEEDLAQVLKLTQELHEQRDALREEMKELRLQQQKSLRDAFEERPDCVTWDGLQAALLADGGHRHTELQSADTHAAPRSPDARRHAAALEALRGVGTLRETFSELEGRVAALEDDEVQLKQLMDNNKGSGGAADDLTAQLKQQEVLMDGLTRERHTNAQLMDGVQTTLLQLRAELEQLQESARSLHDDGRRKQSHIEELYKTTEKLEEKKADRQMVETEIKADKSVLESKVSRLQFDSVTEQLAAMLHQLLLRVSGQEQDWTKVADKLSTQMECKLNRMELDSVKKQLEGRWRSIHEQLQAQGAPEHDDDAAALKRQLVDRFHCLSCDRPVVKYSSSAPNAVKLPSSPGFPAHRSARPFTVYALEQFRQHYRSERMSELNDYSQLSVSRSCGGSHTVRTGTQRRPGLQSLKYTQTETDGVTQSEEVDIVGLDGHIYKGRLNAPAARNTESRLPTISSRDGSCKTRSSKSCRPAASPEGGHAAPLHRPPSANSVQCSRSPSSCSGRDWPVSALGCTSQNSIAPASAESDPETLDL